MIFFLLSQWIFPQIEQKRVGLPGSWTQLIKSFRPFSIHMLHQGFDRELLLNFPDCTSPQCSTNLEGKADHSLALCFRIPKRPDQSRHATEITTQETYLFTLSWWIDRSFLISCRSVRPVFISYIFWFRDFSSKGRWNGWRKPSYQFYWRQILLLEYRSCKPTFRWAKSPMRANVFGKSALLFIQPGCLPGQQR